MERVMRNSMLTLSQLNELEDRASRSIPLGLDWEALRRRCPLKVKLLRRVQALLHARVRADRLLAQFQLEGV